MNALRLARARSEPFDSAARSAVMSEALIKAESNGDPNGIRTRVTAVKGRCPGPLDDRDTKAPQYRIAALGRKANCPRLSCTFSDSYGGQACSCLEQVLWINAAVRTVAPRCWSNTSRAFRTSRWRASVSPIRFSIVR